MNRIEARRDNRDAGENHSIRCHNFQCLDIDRGTFMSHSSIETWAVWSYLSYPYSYSILYRHRDLDFIPKQTSHYPLVLHTSYPLILHITLDVNMSFPPHHASSSSLAMTTPSPPTRSGSESRLLDLPNSVSETRSTMPKTRSPLSPSPYMDIVRVVSSLLLFLILISPSRSHSSNEPPT
jgi:hypothetical protein